MSMMGTPGKMENHIHIAASCLPRRRINQTSRNLKIFQPFAGNSPCLPRGNNRPNLIPGIKEMANEMSTNKTIRAGNEAFHGISFFASSFR